MLRGNNHREATLDRPSLGKHITGGNRFGLPEYIAQWVPGLYCTGDPGLYCTGGPRSYCMDYAFGWKGEQVANGYFSAF